MTRCIFALTILATILNFTSAQDAAKKDLETLQGSWQMTSMQIEGTVMPAEFVKKQVLTFKGDKGSHPGPAGTVEEAIFKLDPSKSPKAMDMTPLNGPGKGKKLEAIYSIEGDVLKICGASEGRVRPTEFEAGKGSIYMMFKRGQ